MPDFYYGIVFLLHIKEKNDPSDLRNRDVYLSPVMTIFGILDFAQKHLDLIRTINAVIIKRISIGD